MSWPQYPYVGRFAPSPSGPLHQGSLIAAMASYLDAKAHHGKWLVRIEDLDFDRNVAGADMAILRSLENCGLYSDAPVVWQSERIALYETAFMQLQAHSYPCACSRKEILDSRIARGMQNLIYPGTCRHGLAAGKIARAHRLKIAEQTLIQFDDRGFGRCQQNLNEEVGDFILKRADGFWAYQLAVVVDDAAQGITHVVRGSDLLDSTARQIYLQRLLGLPLPSYLHIPVLNNDQGEKLSKQTGARAFDLHIENDESALLQHALLPAAQFLGLSVLQASGIEHFWKIAVEAWRQKYS